MRTVDRDREPSGVDPFHSIFSTGRPEVGFTSSPACTKPLRS